MKLWHLPLIGLTALGCGDKDSSADSGSAEADADTDTDTDADTDTDTDTDTDADTDADPELTASEDDVPRSLTTEYAYNVDASATIIPYEDEPDDTGAPVGPPLDEIVGNLSYTYEYNGAAVCDVDVSFTGVEAVGACDGCDFAFSLESEIVRDDSTADCDLYEPWSLTEGYVYANPHIGYWSSYYGYPGVFQSGFSIDYSSYPVYYYGNKYAGFYPGPYWGNILTYSGWSNTTFSWTDDALAWTINSEGSENDPYHYQSYYDDPSCYVLYSGAIQDYGGSAVDYGALDCPEGYAHTIVDVWDVTAAAGDTLSISVDTVASNTAFDPGILVNRPDGCTEIYADDNFDCTYEPANPYGCPSVQFGAPQDGTYQVIIWSWGGCTGTDADYKITVDRE